VELGGRTEEYAHDLCLSLHDRDGILDILDQCGYKLVREYESHELAPWTPGSERWIVLAKKRGCV